MAWNEVVATAEHEVGIGRRVPALKVAAEVDSMRAEVEPGLAPI